jgi:hypothetical protein
MASDAVIIPRLLTISLYVMIPTKTDMLDVMNARIRPITAIVSAGERCGFGDSMGLQNVDKAVAQFENNGRVNFLVA